MKIYKHSNSDEENGRFKHTPEFIYIDDRKERMERMQILKGEQKEYLESVQRIEKNPYPFSMRIATFFGSMTALILAFVLFFAVIVTLFLSMLLLFQNQTLNQLSKKYRHMFQKALVFFLGTFIAVLSPAFGVGIITLYFMLQGEDMDSDYFSRIMKSKFYTGI